MLKKITIQEFLKLSNSDKVEAMEWGKVCGVLKCKFCGRKRGADYYCFGCGNILCEIHDDTDEHYNLPAHKKSILNT